MYIRAFCYAFVTLVLCVRSNNVAANRNLHTSESLGLGQLAKSLHELQLSAASILWERFPDFAEELLPLQLYRGNLWTNVAGNETLKYVWKVNASDLAHPDGQAGALRSLALFAASTLWHVQLVFGGRCGEDPAAPVQLQIVPTLGASSWHDGDEVTLEGHLSLPGASATAKWRSYDFTAVVTRRAPVSSPGLTCGRLMRAVAGDELAVEVHITDIDMKWHSDSHHIEAQLWRATQRHFETAVMASRLGVLPRLLGLEAKLLMDDTAGRVAVRYRRGSKVSGDSIQVLRRLMFENVLCHWKGDTAIAANKFCEILYASFRHSQVQQLGREHLRHMTPCEDVRPDVETGTGTDAGADAGDGSQAGQSRCAHAAPDAPCADPGDGSWELSAVTFDDGLDCEGAVFVGRRADHLPRHHHHHHHQQLDSIGQRQGAPGPHATARHPSISDAPAAPHAGSFAAAPPVGGGSTGSTLSPVTLLTALLALLAAGYVGYISAATAAGKAQRRSHPRHTTGAVPPGQDEPAPPRGTSRAAGEGAAGGRAPHEPRQQRRHQGAHHRGSQQQHPSRPPPGSPPPGRVRRSSLDTLGMRLQHLQAWDAEELLELPAARAMSFTDAVTAARAGPLRGRQAPRPASQFAGGRGRGPAGQPNRSLGTQLEGARQQMWASAQATVGFAAAGGPAAPVYAAAQPQQHQSKSQSQELRQSGGDGFDGVASAQGAPASQGSSEEGGTCLVCLDRPWQHGFLHGGSVHIGVCGECLAALQAAAAGRGRGGLCCPVCRGEVERTVALFT